MRAWREFQKLAREYQEKEDKCTVCRETFQPHKGEKIIFSSGKNDWRVDFRWPEDMCECCALISGMEDYCELALQGGR